MLFRFINAVGIDWLQNLLIFGLASVDKFECGEKDSKFFVASIEAVLLINPYGHVSFSRLKTVEYSYVLQSWNINSGY